MIGEPKFALFGHGLHLCYFVKSLKNKGHIKPVIITHPKYRHQRDKNLLSADPKLYESLFDVANK